MIAPQRPDAHHLHPRLILLVLAVCFTVTGVNTLNYPPDYLLYGRWWAGFAVVSAGACLLASVTPRRTIIATAGSLVVFCSAGRCIALLNEVIGGGLDPVRVASLMIGASNWAMACVLGFVAFQESVLPWSVMIEASSKERNARSTD